MARWRNWTGDQMCRPAEYAEPSDVDGVVDVVRRAESTGRVVRVAGSGHSFSDVVATDGVLVHLGRLRGIRSLERTGRGAVVTVGAGTRLHELNRELDGLGLAMPNLGDIDRQTVAGAVATATHGTGARHGNLATRVVALEMVTADGTVTTIDRGDPETLAAARVPLGALGVVTAVALDVVPAFRLWARDRPMPLAEVLSGIDELADRHDHFEFHLFPHTATALTRTNDVTGVPARPQGRASRWVDETLLRNRGLGAVCRLGRTAPTAIPLLNRLAATALRPAERVDVAHRVFCSRRTVRFTETEWAMPRSAAADAVRAIHLAGGRYDVTLPIEVRFGAADTDAFLSPSWDRDTVFVAAHVYRGMPWEPYFRAVQDIARSFDGRPHWGKRHLMRADALAPLYPAWERFAAVRERLDPQRRFTNPHVTRVLG
ncbi:D-arabinono-1,4-lactone oxidase [Pseudonocardia endophytica]|uniref:D-arabinono-1,4-lactone oxidase n=1 Tax=Pseudonocardia endophytica TaxID=401976 RepID=UPI0014049EFE|nr:D-arabinono-1,4-lactone oxidase [Pseudonocardia endophytica]